MLISGTYFPHSHLQLIRLSFITPLLCFPLVSHLLSSSCWWSELSRFWMGILFHPSCHQAEELCPRHRTAAPRWHGGGISANGGSVPWGAVRPRARPRIPHRYETIFHSLPCWLPRVRQYFITFLSKSLYLKKKKINFSEFNNPCLMLCGMSKVLFQSISHLSCHLMFGSCAAQWEIRERRNPQAETSTIWDPSLPSLITRIWFVQSCWSTVMYLFYQ